MRKLIADNATGVLFYFFNIVDGTMDPDPVVGEWADIALVDHTDDIEPPPRLFLHDIFYDTYWKWRKTRINSNWRLDLYGED